MASVTLDALQPDLKGVYRIGIRHAIERDNTAAKAFYTCRILLFLRGRSTFVFGGETFQTEPGSVLYIPALERYATQFTEDQELVQICFDPIPCRTEQEIPMPPFYAPDAGNPNLLREPVTVTDAPELQTPFMVRGLAEAEAIAAAFLREYSEKLYGYRLRCRGMLLDLLVTLLRLEHVSGSVGQLALTRQILDYIHDHCDSRLDRDTLSAVFHYHPGHISRLVRQATGMTLHQYILEAKLHRAELLLRTTPLPITQIALQLSFYDSSHFSAVFKAHRGILPREYRRLSENV